MSESARSEPKKISDFFVAESVRIGRRNDGTGESVVIRYNTTDQSCVDFALMVEEECWKQGAHTPPARPVSYARERIKLSSKPEDALKQVEPLLVRIAETADVDIYTGEYDNPNFTSRHTVYEYLNRQRKAYNSDSVRRWEGAADLSLMRANTVTKAPGEH